MNGQEHAAAWSRARNRRQKEEAFLLDVLTWTPQERAREIEAFWNEAGGDIGAVELTYKALEMIVEHDANNPQAQTEAVLNPLLNLRTMTLAATKHPQVIDLGLELAKKHREVARALLKNAYLSQEQAARLSYLAQDLALVKPALIQAKLTTQMSYRFLERHDLLKNFQEEIEQVERGTLESLAEGWGGSLEDLLEASRELGQE